MFYFLCLFFTYYLCEKFYKPMTMQYYIADCLSSVSRLSLLDLDLTNKLGLPTLRTELVGCRGLTVLLCLR